MKTKTIILNVILFFTFISSYAQPNILYTSLTSTTPAPNNSRFAINDLGLFRQVRFQANQSIAASTATWAYHRGTTSVPDYNNNWRPNTAGNTISINTYIPTSFANGAKYNSGGGGADGLLPIITSGNYYTFNVLENIAALDNPSEILETTYQPINLISQSLVAPITTNNGAFLTVTASATPNAAEYVYVRYSTDGYATSSIVPVVFSSVTGTTTLPCFAGGTNVRYYYFSSNKTAAQLATDVAAYGQATAYDLATLSILNNGGSNYNYTQPINNNFEGTYYVPSACYPTLASFITAINAGTVANNVIVNIAAGYTETAPITGFRLTANGGVASKSITFQKNGSGVDPTFTASGSLAVGAINDAIFKIVGSDFVTIDGLTFLENPANTTIAALTNNMVEFGIALSYATVSNGCQNITIKNNLINLDRTYQNTFGIYSNNSHDENAVTVAAPSTSATGSNSNLVILSNTITDVNIGIAVVGSTGANDFNNNIQIGGIVGEGNIISNFGTSNAISSYNIVSATVNGILVKNTNNFSITSNSISSSNGGVTTTGNIRGIYVQTFSNTPSGTFVNTISDNSISIIGGNITNILSGIEVEATTGTITSELNIRDNNFTNFNFLPTGATGAVKLINNRSINLTTNINSNVFTAIASNTSGSFTFIDNSFSLTIGATKNVNANAIITSFNKTIASGTVTFYQDAASSVTGSFVNNIGNNFSNVTLTGVTVLAGWNNQDGGGASSPTKIITGNVFNNLNIPGGASCNVISVNGFGDNSKVNDNSIILGLVGVINFNGITTGSNSPGNSLEVNNNTVQNITTGIGQLTGITLNTPSSLLTVADNSIIQLTTSIRGVTGILSTNASATITIKNNNCSDFYSTSTGASDVIGISNTATCQIDITDNVIQKLFFKSGSVSSGVLRGISCSVASLLAGYIPDITGNTIKDSRSDSASNNHLLNGIYVAGSANYNISNNQISNVVSTCTNPNNNSSIGFSGIMSTSSGSTQKINNNTIANFSNANFVAADTKVAAILVTSASGGSEIYKNKIRDINNTCTGANASIYGIFIPNNGIWTVANNMISLNSTNDILMYGINDLGSTTTNSRKYFYNSIHLRGNSAGTKSTFAMSYTKASSGSSSANIQDNIFQNVRTGNGKNYAFGNTGPNFTSLTFSNNILYSNNPNTIGLTSGSTDRDFTSWNTASAGTNSFSSFTQFADPATADLHIDANSCSDANNTGTPVAILDDFDAEPRDLITPDIGADEHTKTSTIWDGTSWNPATPTSTDLAIIEGDYDMTLGISRPNIEACSLIIRNNAKATVSLGKYINLQNNLTIANNALLEVQNGGSLVQVNNNGLNQSGTTASVSNFSLKRNANIRELDYVYWSAPVAAFPVRDISPATPLSKIWNWNTVVTNPNGGQGNWENTTENMIAGKGYILRGPIGWNATVPTTFTTTFLGKPNNGIYTPTIQRGTITAPSTTGSNGVVFSNLADNWNLIGNPYPSALNAAAFLTANTNINGAIRIWTHGALPVSVQNPFYNSFVYNYTQNDYIVYNGTATTSGPAGFNGNIAAGQGFFVVMNDGLAITDKVAFTNAMRNKTFANNQFYRSTNTTNNLDFESLEKHRIWLDLISETGQNVRTVVGYVDGATQEKDRLFDADSSLQKDFNLFSLIGNEVMTIQGRSLPFETNDIVPLGIKVPTSGNFTFAIAAVDGLFANNNQTIYLEDKLSNTIHNLSVTPYQFNSNQGLFTDRFLLRYNDATLLKPNSESLSNSVSVFTSNNLIHISSNQENIKSYIIYDVLGRVLTFGSCATKKIEINTISTNNQALIVKITLENGQIVTKKIVF